MMFTSEFREFFNHDRTSWHVDSNRQRFGSKNNLHKTFNEAGFNSFFKWRNQASMMRGDPRF